jgi:hypothetical protein
VLASLLDLYGIAWRYEPVEFPIAWHGNGAVASAFRPDFYLPDVGIFIELTTAEQRLVTRKNAKVRRFRALYPELRIILLYQRDFLQLCEQHGVRLGVEPAA